MLSEGDEVPGFEAAAPGGATVRSADLAGRRYVVYFYPRDFTPGCTTEAAEFTRLYPEFERAGIGIIGVSPDGAGSHGKFSEKMGIPYPLVADEDRSVCRAFGVWGRKKFMGKEYDGVVRSTFLVGADGRISKVYEDVRPAGHAARVLADFEGK